MSRADGSLNVASAAGAATAAPEAGGVGVEGTGAAAVEADGAGAGAGAFGVATGVTLAGVDGPPAAAFGWSDVRKKEKKERISVREAYFRNHAYYEPLLFNIVRLDGVRILKDFA
jgi:hypothetical protein